MHRKRERELVITIKPRLQLLRVFYRNVKRPEETRVCPETQRIYTAYVFEPLILSDTLAFIKSHLKNKMSVIVNCWIFMKYLDKQTFDS